MRIPTLWIGVMVAVGSIAGVASIAGEVSAQEDDSTRRLVTLVVDYADGVQKHFVDVRWHQGMTVLDVLLAARQHPRGIQFQHRGSGATALLTKIDDIQNEGGRGRNWIFRVNGKLGDRSFAICPLEPGDAVLWEFDVYR